MTGVPDDLVARRLEQSMKRDRQLDDPERRAEMATGLGDRRDDRLADVGRKRLELLFGQPAQVGGPIEFLEDRHAGIGSDGRMVGSGDGSRTRPVMSVRSVAPDASERPGATDCV